MNGKFNSIIAFCCQHTAMITPKMNAVKRKPPFIRGHEEAGDSRSKGPRKNTVRRSITFPHFSFLHVTVSCFVIVIVTYDPSSVPENSKYRII